MDREYLAKREHHRIDVRVPFAAKRVHSEEIEGLESYAVGHTKDEICQLISPRGSLTDNLSDFLEILNCKLDTIISMLTIQQHGFSNLPRVKINLSGGGLSFATKENLKIGDFLEIKLLLDSPKPVGLILYGEVLRVVKLTDTLNEIGIRFIRLSEDLRDLIVRFVLYKEKELVRKRKELT